MPAAVVVVLGDDNIMLPSSVFSSGHRASSMTLAILGSIGVNLAVFAGNTHGNMQGGEEVSQSVQRQRVVDRKQEVVSLARSCVHAEVADAKLTGRYLRPPFTLRKGDAQQSGSDAVWS